MQIVKLKPYYSEKIWGSSKLKELGFPIPENKKIGEAWVISAHNNGMSYLTAGTFKDQPLKTVFENNRNLFGNYQGEYPLLAKIITAADYLSVQVHPNDEYAMAKHHQLGKPESWYILDCPENAKLIYGHNAQSKAELEALIANGNWQQLLKEQPIKPGDFLFVDTGKVHAITPGVTVYELQRSSDITYRLYDYDRLDEQKQPRRLDLIDSINCTSVPDTSDLVIKNAEKKVFSSSVFSIYLLKAKAEKQFIVDESTGWLQFTIIRGQGTINNQKFTAGESAISLGELEPIEVTGDLEVIISWIKK
ncbi:type I phosphomannose isomerase catalytic subunit [Mesoplasma seiffertii]|uniref:type I phosphomannose isomerase catalytic subunit n=1 Tax=Mesoplasma seiffertii TaxID=28224 RepID=UPI00047E0541|nr:type I phosphomannose isomerase catalytic subunit [Mesoplasma seiffertii]